MGSKETSFEDHDVLKIKVSFQQITKNAQAQMKIKKLNGKNHTLLLQKTWSKN